MDKFPIEDYFHYDFGLAEIVSFASVVVPGVINIKE